MYCWDMVVRIDAFVQHRPAAIWNTHTLLYRFPHTHRYLVLPTPARHARTVFGTATTCTHGRVCFRCPHSTRVALVIQQQYTLFFISCSQHLLTCLMLFFTCLMLFFSHQRIVTFENQAAGRYDTCDTPSSAFSFGVLKSNMRHPPQEEDLATACVGRRFTSYILF